MCEKGNFEIQSALVISVFAVCGFDFLRTRKQGKTENNQGQNRVLALFMHKKWF